MALQGSKLRMAFARQAKQIKQQGTYGELPAVDKLITTLKDEMDLYETYIYLREKDHSAGELAGLLELPEDKITSMVESLKKKNLIS
jgi:DNA-binding MarR family transcriptional regulator